MKYLFLAYFTMFQVIACYADMTIDTTTFYSYKGLINKQPVRMSLKVTRDQIYGEYVYLKYGDPIYLYGRIKGDSVVMSESNRLGSYIDPQSVSSDIIGLFRLKFDKSGNLSGLWEKPSKKKNATVKLEKIYSLTYKKYKLEYAIRNHNPLYKIDTIAITNEGKFRILNMNNTAMMGFINHKFGAKDSMFAPKQKDYSVTDTGLVEQEELLSFQLPYRYSDLTDIDYAGPFILSVSADGYEYEGGAHGNGGTTYYNYSLQTGSEIKLFKEHQQGVEGDEKITDTGSVAFKDGAEGYLDSLGAIYFMYEAEPSDSQAIRTLTTKESYHVASQYSFTISGIYFQYNAYELDGGFMMGMYGFSIPYKALKPIINPEGPLGWVLKEF